MREFVGWAKTQPAVDALSHSTDELRQHGLFKRAA
jgi:hypothetical protein